MTILFKRGFDRMILLLLVSYMLKSLLSAFNHSQNALVKLRGGGGREISNEGELTVIHFFGDF